MGAVSELLKQLDSLHSYDLLNQYAMKSLTIAPDNPKAYCWLIRSLKAQGMNAYIFPKMNAFLYSVPHQQQ